MKPGQELDALVARHVFGLDPEAVCTGETEFFDGAEAFYRCGKCGLNEYKPSPHKVPVKPYSTSISCAWEVVDYVRGDFSYEEWETFCGLLSKDKGIFRGDAPLRICEAALKAKGVKVHE